MALKDIIKSRRLELNLTQKEVADFVGVSEATLSRWESGEIKNVGSNRLASLANILNLDPSILIGSDEHLRELELELEAISPALDVLRKTKSIDLAEDLENRIKHIMPNRYQNLAVYQEIQWIKKSATNSGSGHSELYNLLNLLSDEELDDVLDFVRYKLSKR